MIKIILELAVIKMLPYLAPLIFILSAFTVADRLIDLIRESFSGSSTRRRSR